MVLGDGLGRGQEKGPCRGHSSSSRARADRGQQGWIVAGRGGGLDTDVNYRVVDFSRFVIITEGGWCGGSLYTVYWIIMIVMTAGLAAGGRV